MRFDTELNVESSSDTSMLQCTGPDRPVYFALKRATDVVLSLLLLVLASPIMLVIALAIRLYSPGPVFFSQTRVGARRVVRGRDLYWQRVNFRCLKFRTMHANADPAVHAAYVTALIRNDQAAIAALQPKDTAIRKLVHDERITRPGKLLRKLSLDELPQLWNVLRGDMSLVGPRPAIPYEVDVYSPWHLRRLEAQPGLTGLQQVTARSTADFDEQVRLDLRYIAQRSWWLDWLIILKTPLVILSTRGAG